MPNFFAAMAHRPEALNNFLPFYTSIVTTGSVETRYKELIYLKTSMINQCRVCTRAHTAAAKRVGLSDQQIQALSDYEESDQFDEKEKAVLGFAEYVAREAARHRPEVTESLKEHFSDEQIAELTLAACMANFTNRFNNALDLEPDIG